MKELHVWSALATHHANWDLGFHQHASLEVAVLLEGRGLFETKEHTFTIEPGHVIVIPSDIAHRFYAITPIRLAVFQAEHILSETMDLFQKLAPQPQVKLYSMSQFDVEQYYSLFRQWLRVLSESISDKEKYINTWIQLFLHFLMQHVHSDQQVISVTNAADYIRNNLQEELRISDLAKYANLSESGFRRMFKEAYGLTPKQYQQQCRMVEAKWLLRSTEKTIQAISEQVGFVNLHSFSSWFQNNEGVSPSEWRKQQRVNI